MKIVIIGNGILALTTAFRLLGKLKPDDHVVIIGKKERRGSATLVAPAMLNSFAELEVDTLRSAIGQYKFQLSLEATKAWPAFLTQIMQPEQNAGFDTGTYVVNNTAADELDDENFDAILTALQTYQEPYEWVTADDIPNYAPSQKNRAQRAIYINNEGWFNPRLLVKRLDAIFSQHPQVTVIDKYVDDIIQKGNEIDCVETEDGEIVAGDKYLLAIGAATTDLITKSQLSIAMQRVFYGVGVTLQIHSPEYPHQKCVRTPNRGLACGLYTTPYSQGPNTANNHIAIGASNFISAVPGNRGRLISVSTLMTSAIDQINANFYKAELVNVNVGERPVSQDGHPLIGKTSIKNLVIATGTRREGIHLAPVLSDRLSELVLGHAVEAEFMLFQPERKLICDLSREDAIKKAVKHYMSALYQHGFVPPYATVINKLKEKQEDDLQRLHDKMNAFDWGIPTDMLDMYRYGHAVLPQATAYAE